MRIMNWSSVQSLLRHNKTSEETAFVSNFDTRFLTKCLTNFILSNIIEIFRKIFYDSPASDSPGLENFFMDIR